MKKISALITVALLLIQAIIPITSASSSIKILKDLNSLDTQTGSVTNNLGLYGGQAEDIEVDSTSNNVYVTTMSPNGFFISTDSGENFHGLPNSVDLGTGKSVEINPANGDVYGLIGDSVIKSTDHGTSFTDITKNLGQVGGALGEELLFAHNKLLVASSAGPGSTSNLYISDNGGTSFSGKTVGSNQIKSLAASPQANVFYAATTDNNIEKLYKSENGGTTWDEVAINPSTQRISTIGIDPQQAAGKDHIIICNTNGDTSNSVESTDGGASWTAILDSSNHSISSNYIAFDGAGRTYIGQNYKENGVWQQMNTNTPLSGIYADSFAFDPKNVNVLFTNSNYSLAKSTNRGQSWTDQTSGISAVKSYDVAQAKNKNIVWIAANGGLAKTTNFTSASPDWQYPVSGTQGSQSFAVWIKPDDPDTVIYGASEFLNKTTDGGSTWKQVGKMADAGGNVKEIAAVPGNNNILYAAHGNDDLARTDTGAVFKSTDGGSTWTNINIPGNAPAGCLTVAKDGDVYVGANSRDTAAPKGVYKYSNGSWAKLQNSFSNIPITSILADPENANTILVTTNADTGAGSAQGSSLYKSKDGGKTWSLIDGGLNNINNLDTLTVQTSTTPNTFYVTGQSMGTAPAPKPGTGTKAEESDSDNLKGVIYKSSDGGESWGLYYTGKKQEQFYSLLFDGLVAGNNKGLYGMQSRAKLNFNIKSAKTVERGTKVALKASLTDAIRYTKKAKITKKVGRKKVRTTKTIRYYKKLAGRSIVIQYKKKVRNPKTKKWVTRWISVKKLRKRSNKDGEVTFTVTMTSKKEFRAAWSPSSKNDKAEFATATSKSIALKVK